MNGITGSTAALPRSIAISLATDRGFVVATAACGHSYVELLSHSAPPQRDQLWRVIHTTKINNNGRFKQLYLT